MNCSASLIMSMRLSAAKLPFLLLPHRSLASFYTCCHQTVLLKHQNAIPLHHQWRQCSKQPKMEKRRQKKASEILRQKKKLLGIQHRTPSVMKVISTGSYNSCKSVNIRAGNKVYLFNCGDNTMRRCFESRTPWSGIQHLFVTHKSYKNLCGLVEMAMNLMEMSDGKVFTLGLHGSGDLGLMVTPSLAVFAKSALLNINRHPINEPFEDNVMRVENIQLRDVTRPDDDDLAACAFKLNIFAGEPSVDPQKLIKYCVKLDSWVTPLVRYGETVEVNGRTITPDMVLNRKEKDETVVVIDCPTANHLPSLSAHTERLSRTDDGDFIDLVVHMTPHHITEHQVYQQFMTSFPVTTQHVIVSEQVEATSLRNAWDQQVHYNLVDKDMFPILHPKPVDEVKEEASGNVLIAQPGLSNTIARRTWITAGCNRNALTKAAAMSYFNDDSAHIDRVLEAINERISLTDEAVSREYPVVSMLGTSAAKPSGTRNTAGILVEICKDSYALLDCGNGILGQLTHLYGPERTNHILRNLNMVFVSHKHHDHHGGLLALFNARLEAFDGQTPSKLHFVCPGELRGWCLHLHRMFGCLQGVRLLNCSQMSSSKGDVYHKGPSDVQLLGDTGLSSVSTFKVKHIRSTACYGISLQHSDYKLVYSGDTMPCEQLVRAAMDADLLIHEATFGDAYWRDALKKTHSTVSQALDVARRCRAKFTLLTHFSSIHHRVPPFSQQLMESSNVGVAMDNMVLRPKDLPNTTFASLWNVTATMHPQYAAIAKKRDTVRTVAYQKQDRVAPEEILESVNKMELGKI